MRAQMDRGERSGEIIQMFLNYPGFVNVIQSINNSKFSNIKTIVFIAILCSSVLFCNGQVSKDIELVTKVIRDFQSDFNDGGFKNAYSYTTSDWEHINPLGGISKGRENVLNEVRAVHQSFLKGVTMKMESIKIRFIAPSVAIGDVIHIMDDFTTPDGIKHLNERQIKTYIVVKKEDKWLLTHDHNTTISQ